jgi:hypothetical protein
MRADLKYPLVLTHFVLYYTQMQEMDEVMAIALGKFVELSKVFTMEEFAVIEQKKAHRQVLDSLADAQLIHRTVWAEESYASLQTMSMYVVEADHSNRAVGERAGRALGLN